MSLRLDIRIGLVACIACASSLPVAASAQERMRPNHEWNARGDVHGRGDRMDGGRRPSPDGMFARIDANHDGSISRSEFMAFHAQRMAMRERRGMGPAGGWGSRPDATRRTSPSEAGPR